MTFDVFPISIPFANKYSVIGEEFKMNLKNKNESLNVLLRAKLDNGWINSANSFFQIYIEDY